MRDTIDSRSLTIGLLLGILGILAMGAAKQKPPDWDLEFATENKAHLNRRTGEYQRLARAGKEGILQRVGNIERPQ